MKKSVIKSNKKLPGYPQYGKKNDIYQQAKPDDIDTDNFNREVRSTIRKKKKTTDDNFTMESPQPESLLTGEEEISLNENDLTLEDELALGDMDGDNDEGEDELLKKDRAYPIDMSGDDLDIPGDDEDNDLSDDDEENKLFSQPDN